MYIFGRERGVIFHRQVAGFVLLGCMMAACSVTWTHTPECFETRVRASAHSLCNALGRIGSFLTCFFVNSSLSIGTVALGLTAACAACALSALALPETRGKRLE